MSTRKERANERAKKWYQENKARKKTYDTEYRSNHADQRKEQHKQYYLEHQEEIKLKVRKWKDENREHVLSEKRRWRSENKERISIKKKEYYKSDRGRLVACKTGHTHRARKKNQIGPNPPTTEQLRELYASPCHYCGAPSKHIDHVIPLAKGGLHDISNLVGACVPCNLSKGDRIIQ